MNKTTLLLPLILIAGCTMFGANPKAPNTVENGLYDVLTNQVAKQIQVTNVHEVTIEVPVFRTNELNQVVWQTNTVQQNITNVSSAWVTNDAYTLTPKESTKAGVAVVGTAVNTFFPGVGTMVSTGLLAILGAWGHARSWKRGSALGAITQEVETTREFIKALPNGQHYDDALVQWIQDHQAELGVANTVVPIIDRNVSNPEAKVGAQEIIDTINALLAQKIEKPSALASPTAPIGAVSLSS